MQQPKLGFSSGLFPFLLLFLACYFTTGTDSVAISLTSRTSSSSTKSGTESDQEPVKCKNEQGKDVDWFMVYKLPKNRTSSNPLVRAGLAYAYILPSTLTSSSRTKDGGTSGGGNISAGENTSSLFSTEGVGSTARGHHPHHHDHEPGVGTGTAAAAAWTLSGNGIDSPGSMVGQTLKKVYLKQNRDDAAPVAFLTYNDQPSVGPVIMSGGHSKGVVVTSLASGFWIQHSVPHFPLIELNNPHYQYPRTGESNGQIFHCISFPSAKDVDNLGRILEITKPHIANYSFPTDPLKNALPQLMEIVKRHHRRHQDEEVDIDASSINNTINQSHQINTASNDSGQQLSSPSVNEVNERACLAEQLNANNGSNYQTVPDNDKGKNFDLLDIRSAGGKSFRAYIKGPSFHEEIYSAWIAPTYRTQLKVQSWLNGPNPFPSNCSSINYSVYNIQEKNIAGHGFSTHNDHSKWALSIEQPLVCISDLNRMEHQLKRGGVTVCFMDSSTWSTFNSSIIDVQPCPRLAIVADHHPDHDGVGNGNGNSSHHPTPNFGTDIVNHSKNSGDGGGEAAEAEVVNMTGATTNVANDDDDNDDIKMWIVGHIPDSKHFRPRHNSFHQKRQRKVKSRTYSLAGF